MRYRLRTLLIVLGVAPPVLAGAWILAYELYRADSDYFVSAVFCALILTVWFGAWIVAGIASRGAAGPLHRR